MSIDALQEIVESIGALSDRAEKDKWVVAEAVAVAYAEFPAYTRGLTAGLCQRLRKSSDLIYSLRDSWELKSLLHVSDSPLSVSHFATLAHLRDRYNISDADLREWVTWAEENCISVRELSIEISTRHTADQRKEFFKRSDKLSKLLERLWQDAEGVSMPEPLRIITKSVLTAVRSWLVEVEKWRDG